MDETEARPFRLGEWFVNPPTGVLRSDTEVRRIEPVIMDVLVMLAGRAGQVVTKQELLDAVWKGAAVTDDALTGSVYQLRRALGDNARRPRYIETLPKRGYRLLVEAEISGAGPPRTAVAHEAPIVPVPENRAPPATVGRPPRPAAAVLIGALAAAACAVLLGYALAPPLVRPPHPLLRRFDVSLPTLGGADPFWTVSQVPFALSPGGGRLVFALDSDGKRRLYDRALDRVEASGIPGTEGADNPFFSPDGQWIGFGADGKLKKIPAAGGEPRALCDAPNLRGASWGDDGFIVFAPSPSSGLWRVSADGGTPRPLTTLAATEVAHRWPQVLPGGKTVLFSVVEASLREERRAIALVSTESGERRTLFKGATYPRYVGTGHLLYAKGGSLYAVPFARDPLQITGPAVAMLDDLRVWYKTSGAAFFDVAVDGTLAYVSGHLRRPERTLVRVDRHGASLPLPGPARSYTHPVVSPDGLRVAVCVEGPDDHVWVVDLAQKTWARVTDEADNNNPTWSPDGRRLVVSSNRNGPRNLYSIPAEGGSAEPLTEGAGWRLPASFTPDGRSVLFTDMGTDTRIDIWSVSLGGDRRPRAVLTGPANEMAPAVSPDGRWLAYVSSESGRDEVYVKPYAGGGATQQVSSGGGSQPVWAKSGRELFYRNGTWMMVVPVAARPGFRAGSAQVLFETRWGTAGTVPDYDVFPDGQHFVMVETLPEDTARSIVVIPDWFQELRARVP